MQAEIERLRNENRYYRSQLGIVEDIDDILPLLTCQQQKLMILLPARASDIIVGVWGNDDYIKKRAMNQFYVVKRSINIKLAQAGIDFRIVGRHPKPFLYRLERTGEDAGEIQSRGRSGRYRQPEVDSRDPQASC
jgi:hypothetical protein